MYQELIGRSIWYERIFEINPEGPTGFTFSFLTKVGGRTIQFHRDAINGFLGNPLVLQEGQMRRYQESINMVPNMEKISKKILLDRKQVERNSSGASIRLHIQPGGQPDAGHHFMTPEEFQTHIMWLGYSPLYQGETVGHGDENDEEDAKAEMENEEGTSGDSKTTSDDDEEMRGQ
ncbi:hypothetical protein KIW84_023986 [Lathyrus oleraceus]|uniref:Uncharacterized protein n=1 Tax=Pisum sativum TaxID=3888 RepID=A0A9D4YEF5_PEA|nr:hypothetical protein KIW84_023986 [Pisum sativum]